MRASIWSCLPDNWRLGDGGWQWRTRRAVRRVLEPFVADGGGQDVWTGVARRGGCWVAVDPRLGGRKEFR